MLLHGLVLLLAPCWVVKADAIWHDYHWIDPGDPCGPDLDEDEGFTVVQARCTLAECGGQVDLRDELGDSVGLGKCTSICCRYHLSSTTEGSTREKSNCTQLCARSGRKESGSGTSSDAAPVTIVSGAQNSKFSAENVPWVSICCYCMHANVHLHVGDEACLHCSCVRCLYDA